MVVSSRQIFTIYLSESNTLKPFYIRKFVSNVFDQILHGFSLFRCPGSIQMPTKLRCQMNVNLQQCVISVRKKKDRQNVRLCLFVSV
jgi:hypothetical protein